MFSSDRDLRKPVPKKSPITRTGKPQVVVSAKNNAKTGETDQQAIPQYLTSKKDDIVEIAKHEREARAILREKVSRVLTIQAWWRGRIAVSRYFSESARRITSKLDDIEKIVHVFGQKGSSTFVTPPEITISLIKEFNVLSWNPCRYTADLLPRLCKLVVLPSAADLDVTKNIVATQLKADANMLILTRFYIVCMRSLLPVPVGQKSTKSGRKGSVSPRNDNVLDKGSICLALQALVGAHAPYKMKYSADLRQAFLHMRQALAVRHGGLRFFRTYFMHKCRPLLTAVAINDAAESTSLRVTANTRPKVSSDADHIFSLCLFLTECACEDSPGSVGDTVRQFVYHIASVPMLTLLLTAETLQAFPRWSLFHAMLVLVAEPSDVECPGRPSDGPSSLQVISSGQWVLGNLASLAPFLMTPTTSATTSSSSPAATQMEELASEDLLLYLGACSAWLGAYAVSDILQGRSGIFWQQQGTNSIAVAVPSGLEEQLLTLLHPVVLSALSQRIMSSVCTPFDVTTSADAASAAVASKDVSTVIQEQWSATYGLVEDIKDVSEALASSAYKITHATLKDHQEASTWFTAKWAKKITSSISSSLGFSSLLGSSSASASASAKPSYLNTLGKAESTLKPSSKVQLDKASDVQLIHSLCALWSVLLPSAASAAPDSLPWKALSQLAFVGPVPVLPRLWCFLLDQCKGNLDSLAKNFVVNAYESGGRSVSHQTQQCFNVLFALAAVLRMVLIVLDDSELYEAGRPLPLHQILRLVRCLKVILFKVLREDPTLLTDTRAGSSSTTTTSTGTEELRGARIGLQRRQLHLSMRAVSSVLADLYSRWARRPFSSASLWEIKEAGGKAVLAEIQERTSFGQSLLRVMPWAVDFHERMKYFRSMLDAERLAVQGSNDAFNGPQRSRGVVVRVRKARILEDGMEAMARVGASIKDRIVVKYVNDFGEEEAGIDAGGLFKDFVTDLSGRIFDPSYGLFCTTSANLMYPNPSASVLFDPHEMDSMFVFLGRVLGKALFENITLQPQFAHFFLAFMHGKYNFMNLINDLNTLDPELYKNLMFLKTYDGDIADLGLTFSVTDTSMGGQKEVELLPGGANMDVTSQNRHRYINLTAKYYLHDRLKRQAKAFFSGLYQVVQPELLQIFCAPELQILISGSQTGLSVQDLRQHTRYAGGYISLDVHMTRFWSVFAELSEQDQALLLKFVTSCERPPSLGFASLQPPFTIQKVDCSDDQRLPTASTCFNILKLPTYSSSKVMKEKLLQSIRARAGFDLS